jgi:CBS domain-containing protein
LDAILAWRIVSQSIATTCLDSPRALSKVRKNESMDSPEADREGRVANADRFLAAFSGIERKLRELADADRSASFYSVVDRAAQQSRAVAQFRTDLKEYADLRNAIVHERGDGYPIADPRDRAVHAIEEIRRVLEDPPRLLQVVKVSVEACVVDDPVGRAARQMYDGDFSQLPVYDNGSFVALLTAETVARWLAACLEGGIGLVEEAPVRDVLAHTEDADNHRLVPRDATVFDALQLFDAYNERGKSLDAVLITHAGRREEKLLGIVTIYDIPRLLAAIRP